LKGCLPHLVHTHALAIQLFSRFLDRLRQNGQQLYVLWPEQA
jgi:hypothetical protein